MLARARVYKYFQKDSGKNFACKDHPDQEVKYLCKEHWELICTQCKKSVKYRKCLPLQFAKFTPIQLKNDCSRILSLFEETTKVLKTKLEPIIADEKISA